MNETTTYRAVIQPPHDEPLSMEVHVTVDVPMDYIIQQIAHTGLRDLHRLKIMPMDCSTVNGDELSCKVLGWIVMLDEQYFSIAKEWARQIPEMRHMAFVNDGEALDFLGKINRYAMGDETMLDGILDYFYPIWRGFVDSKYKGDWLRNRFISRLKAELNQQLGVRYHPTV